MDILSSGFLLIDFHSVFFSCSFLLCVHSLASFVSVPISLLLSIHSMQIALISIFTALSQLAFFLARNGISSIGHWLSSCFSLFLLFFGSKSLHFLFKAFLVIITKNRSLHLCHLVLHLFLKEHAIDVKQAF